MKLFFVLLFSFNLDASESLGYYSSGSQKNATSVFENKTRIHKLFLKRERLYTSDQMHSILNDLSDFSYDTFPDNNIVEVGDLSLKNGGQAKGHASHQNGLDVDIVYVKKNNSLQNPNSETWEEDFILNSRVSDNFDIEKNFLAFSFLTLKTPVTRIFVDKIVKKAMCDYVSQIGKMDDPKYIYVLNRLRIEDLHRTHYHVRIACPMNNNNCKSQPQPPAGSGCDDFSMSVDIDNLEHGC